MSEKKLLTSQFAAQAGVTVRPLHHYDRLGLLKPQRTASGYRVYRRSDLARLEQIVALKFLGIPLKEIRSLLDRNYGQDLRQTLRAQRHALEEKRRMLDAAITAISHAENSSAADAACTDPALLKSIIEVIEMQSNVDWTSKYYDGEALERVETGKARSPELQAKAEQDWSDLYRDVRDAIDADPAGERAQALLDRRNALVAQFTGGHAGVEAGLRRMHQDRANWPADVQQKMSPFSDPAVGAFFERAEAARRQQHGS